MDRLLELDMDALQRLSARTKDIGYVKAEDDLEQECLEVLTYVDHITRHVPGSNTRQIYEE